MKSVNVKTASSSLILISPPETSEQAPVSPGTMLLGLPLLRRSVLAASRAGFERILVSTSDPAEARPLLDGTPATALPSGELLRPGRMVFLAANVLPHPKWLRTLLAIPIEPGQMYLDADVVAVIEAADSQEILSVLSRGLRSSDLFSMLRQSFKTIHQPLDQKGRLVLAAPQDVLKGEDWLLRGLVKETDGFMSRHVERRLSLAITRRLVSTRMTPNTMTAVSVGIGLLGAPFFLSSRPAYQLAGALLVLLHSILDGCDGELARLRFQESRWGGLFDFWGDNAVHATVFLCMAVGWSLATQAAWPLLWGAVAVAGSLGSAGFIYRCTMKNQRSGGPLFNSIVRSPTTALSRLLDFLARRDFIFLIVLLSAFGKAEWFLVLVAAGVPVFFVLLLWIARDDCIEEERFHE